MSKYYIILVGKKKRISFYGVSSLGRFGDREIIDYIKDTFYCH